MQNLNALRK